MNHRDRLRALNLPKPVKVELDVSGKPRAVGQSAVEAVLDSWRIDDEWWRKPIARGYYEIVLTGGKRIVLFENLITREWWMQKP